MFIIVSKYLIPKGYRGLTIFPFIFLKNKTDRENAALLNHEHIHIRQQLELLVLPFFVWYAIEFLFLFIRYKDGKKAYHSISFEREAYANERNPKYLKNKSFWSFLKYL